MFSFLNYCDSDWHSLNSITRCLAPFNFYYIVLEKKLTNIIYSGIMFKTDLTSTKVRWHCFFNVKILVYNNTAYMYSFSEKCFIHD